MRPWRTQLLSKIPVASKDLTSHTCHRNLAMDSVKLSMEGLDLPSSRFGHPVAYTFMYVQWEANRVIQSLHHLNTYTFFWEHEWVLLVNSSSLLSDYWETAGSQHGTCLCGDCPCQPSPHSRPHRQVRNLLRRTDLRSNSAFSFSPVSPFLSSRSLAGLTSWGSPLKLSLPSFSSSGMLHHSIEIKIMLCILKDYLLHKFILLTSVGLALDYAAHIGVTYVVTKGKNRRERAQASVSRFSSVSPFSSTATLDQIK